MVSRAKDSKSAFVLNVPVGFMLSRSKAESCSVTETSLLSWCCQLELSTLT